MKMKKLLTFMVVCTIALQSYAQAARNNHVYFHVGFGSSHVYTATLPSLVFWGLNSLMGTDTFENALEYTFSSGDVNGSDLKTRNYDVLGYTARELFANCHPYIKLGYQSKYMSNVNWGVYATAEYAHNQFDSKIDGITEYERNTLDRALFGGSAFLVFGGIDKKYKFMVEGGLRYSMVLDYKGPLANDKQDLRNGLVGHYAITVKGSNAIQNFGIFADINHFNLLKDDQSKLNMITIGLMWSVTPGQSKSEQLKF